MMTTRTTMTWVRMALGAWLAALCVTAWAAETSSTAVSRSDKPTSIALDSGIIYQDLVIGTGPEPRPEQKIGIHYVGKVIETGREIDNSRIKILPNPLRFIPNDGKIIRGIWEGMIGMRVGGRRVIEIPPALGYGEQGVPPEIPPHSRLLFDIELVEVRDVSTAEAAAMTQGLTEP